MRNSLRNSAEAVCFTHGGAACGWNKKELGIYKNLLIFVMFYTMLF